MATQVITVQSGVAARGDEQGVDGRLARFISTARELVRVYLSTRGTINRLEPENRARFTAEETAEFDANMLGF